MRLPYIMLTAMTGLALASCAHAGRTAAGGMPGMPPTQLPPTVTLDDKLGIAVETAYQAATLAVRSAVQAGRVTPAQAVRLSSLDNRAYTYVCYTRTAYDLANGSRPAARKDGCPEVTKTGTIPTYGAAAQSAIITLRSLMEALGNWQQNTVGSWQDRAKAAAILGMNDVVPVVNEPMPASWLTPTCADLPRDARCEHKETNRVR